MIILAIESSAEVASVAICSDKKTLYEKSISNGHTHSMTILPMIDEALRALSLNINDIDLFATDVGPGSFTGIRIGVSTIKGLAFGSSKPCAGVSSLEALAYNLIKYENTLLCPVMNARRGQLYNALFKVKNSELVRLTPDRIIMIDELDTELSGCYYSVPVMLNGDGYNFAVSEFKHTSPMQTPDELVNQSAASVAAVARVLYGKNKFTSDIGLSPVYLRPTQAEQELNRKRGKNAE